MSAAKKSKAGIKTPKEDMDLIHTRPRAAKLDDEACQTKQGTRLMSRKTVSSSKKAAPTSTPTWAMPLAAEIARAIKAQRLTQQGAAELLGVDQSKVSRIARGQFRGVSEAKLLSALGLELVGVDWKIARLPHCPTLSEKTT